MIAGELDHILTFQIRTVGTPPTNEYGEPNVTWVTAFELRGAFQPLGSREFPVLDKAHAETTARFRTRYKPELDPAEVDYTANPGGVSAIYRIQLGTQLWDIQPPTVIGRKAGLLIEASVTA